MFIVSPTRGGYRGDVVNSGFRQGRRDAYRDYIDNFNFATEADAANSALNQLDVERVAKNYGLQNEMAQGARKEALSFVGDSAKVDNAVRDANITFAQNARLNSKADELGQSNANIVFANTAAAENKAGYDANTSGYQLDNVDQANQAWSDKAQAQGLANQNTEETIRFNRNRNDNMEGLQEATRAFGEARNSVFTAQQGFDTANNDLVQAQSMTPEAWDKAFTSAYVASRQQAGDKRPPEEIIAEAKLPANAQKYRESLDAYKQSIIQQAQSQVDDAKAGLTAAQEAMLKAQTDMEAYSVGATGSKGQSKATNKQESYKVNSFKLGDSENLQQFIDKGNGENINENVGLIGRTLYFANGEKWEFPVGYTRERILQEAGLSDPNTTANQNENPLGR